MSGEKIRPELNLSSEGVNLRALLAAVDEVQKDMTPEEKAAMNKRIVTGEEGFTVGPAEMESRQSAVRAAIRIADLLETSIEEGDKIRKDLEEVSKIIEKPAIANLVAYLGQKKLPGEQSNQ